jgi:molybdopterin synthase catalytic subunit
MFELSDRPLDPIALKASLRNPAAGACVTFEGWVRNENEGRPVVALKYEAYAELCANEAAAILKEAHEKFGVLDARCVHRAGELAVGDLAVWVGVCSAHRAEAFEACRWLIDAVKHRLPIWKLEKYADGESGWVNAPCARCAAPTGDAKEAEFPRTDRADQDG